ncbi:MAG: LysM peptidoglycan-binding domain-containing protein [Lachnospiraceae bacterium]|nr:LysM peptidoglycan-binding domain-containing protein [Lachnospiraceae bacterium]
MERFSQCNGIVYVVQPGDTLYEIGRRFQVPVSVLLAANPGIEIPNLPIGHRLCIPARCSCTRDWRQ